MILLSITNLYNNYKYLNPNIVKDYCKEKGCKLQISSDQYYILDGDLIEEYKRSSQLNKSVDCIIISKKPIDEKYEVILCELSSGKKSADVIIEKFKNSGNEISSTFKDNNLNIGNFQCYYLGDLKNLKFSKKRLNKPLNIVGLTDRYDILIKLRKCNYSIE